MSRRLWLGLLVVTLLLAAVVSGYASTSPDGLERVAQEQGFANTQDTEQTTGFAGYDSPVARVLGVVLVLVLAGGVTLVLRRRREE